MNKTTENLWQALREYSPPETKPVIFRLFYNVKTGKPVELTTENKETNSVDIDWIEISRAEANTYPHQDPRVSVVDGKIHRAIKKITALDEPNRLRVKQNSNGNIATDDYNMLIINRAGKNRWKYE